MWYTHTHTQPNSDSVLSLAVLIIRNIGDTGLDASTRMFSETADSFEESRQANSLSFFPSPISLPGLLPSPHQSLPIHPNSGSVFGDDEEQHFIASQLHCLLFPQPDSTETPAQ